MSKEEKQYFLDRNFEYYNIFESEQKYDKRISAPARKPQLIPFTK